MDLIQLLGGLLGQEQKKPIQSQPLQPKPLLPRRRIVPGYASAAQRYESAFDRGDLNSPDIIGVDPKNFGYPADETQTFQQPRAQYKSPIMNVQDLQRMFTRNR